MPVTLLVAAIAAAAIFMIAVGIATSGGGSGVRARPERYASAREGGKATTEGSGQGGIAELLEKSVALAQLNRVVEARDFGANLARDIARADLKLKPSEFLAIWVASIFGLPVICIFLSLGLEGLRNPLAL